MGRQPRRAFRHGRPGGAADGRLEQFQAPFRCTHCNRLSIADAWGNPGEYLSTAKSATFWNDHEVVWTPNSVGGKEFPDVPPHIASAADEVHKCRSINADRAAILLARGVVEAAAKDKGIASGSLFQKIEAMCSAGLVRTFTRDAAHELRFMGNDMAHGDFVASIAASDADAVLDVMSEILSLIHI